MLKFSGFANLTSCLESLRASRRTEHVPRNSQLSAHRMLNKLVAAAEQLSIKCLRNASAHPEAQAITAACPKRGQRDWNNKA